MLAVFVYKQKPARPLLALQISSLCVEWTTCLSFACRASSPASFWARIDGLFFILYNLFDLAPLGKGKLLACLLSKQAVLLAHQANHFPLMGKATFCV
jgi:hypothetical protein